MNAEEFHEAEVMWPDHTESPWKPNTTLRGHRKNEGKQPDHSQSHRKPNTTLQEHPKEVGKGDKKIVPPHILVARRTNEMEEFSVCTGKGRTLKGRDQRYIRDAVLRMTGFIE